MGRPKGAGESPWDGWTVVRGRRRRPGDQWENKQETTFFVENLPNEANNRSLWKAFWKVGRLSDAYVAKKKDSSGNRFGFLRFLNVKDVNEILERADGTKILEAVTKVTLARFDRNHRKFGHLGEPPKIVQETDRMWKPNAVGGERFDVGRRFQHGGMSYKEAVNNNLRTGPARKTIQWDGD